MEIKITISDTSSGQQVTSSPEPLQPVVASGAIDAGRAPTAAGNTQFGAPPPFISGSNLGDVMTSAAVSAGPAAAVPDSGSVVAAVVGPGRNA